MTPVQGVIDLSTAWPSLDIEVSTTGSMVRGGRLIRGMKFVPVCDQIFALLLSHLRQPKKLILRRIEGRRPNNPFVRIYHHRSLSRVPPIPIKLRMEAQPKSPNTIFVTSWKLRNRKGAARGISVREAMETRNGAARGGLRDPGPLSKHQSQIYRRGV